MQEEVGAVSFVCLLRSRIADIDVQLNKLDEGFRAGKISGDEYMEKRQNLKQTRNSLQEELHRMGLVT